MGFEPTRAEPNGLAVHRLNHSATSSHITVENKNKKNILNHSSSYKLPDNLALVWKTGSHLSICIENHTYFHLENLVTGC